MTEAFFFLGLPTLYGHRGHSPVDTPDVKWGHWCVSLVSVNERHRSPESVSVVNFTSCHTGPRLPFHFCRTVGPLGPDSYVSDPDPGLSLDPSILSVSERSSYVHVCSLSSSHTYTHSLSFTHGHLHIYTLTLHSNTKTCTYTDPHLHILSYVHIHAHAQTLTDVHTYTSQVDFSKSQFH